jgi:hypothetical protein
MNVMSQTRARHNLEICLTQALSPLGDGWSADIIEAMADNYSVDLSKESESTISDVEIALRDLLGSSADFFVDRFYSELRKIGFPI